MQSSPLYFGINSTIILYKAEITAPPLSSNTFVFSPPQGIWGLWGPLSAGKLLPHLPGPEGDSSPRQWAPPQLGPEEVQGSHLFLWAQDDSRHLHQSRRRCALDSQKIPKHSSSLQGTPPCSPSALITLLSFCVWALAKGLHVQLWKKNFSPSASLHPFTLFIRLPLVILGCGCLYP